MIPFPREAKAPEPGIFMNYPVAGDVKPMTTPGWVSDGKQIGSLAVPEEVHAQGFEPDRYPGMPIFANTSSIMACASCCILRR